jgi:predicted amidohydrolase YtcJ
MGLNMRFSHCNCALINIFLAAFIAFFSPNGYAEYADSVYFGGDIITVDDKNPQVEALTVLGGKIQALGKLQNIESLLGPETKRIDLKGRALMPGFIDIHSHPILAAMMNQTIDISGFHHDTPEQVFESLKKGIKEKSPGEWVIAYGWDPAIITDLRSPTLQELNALAPNNPLFIISQTLHSGFVNSLAYQAASINKNTPNPAGGYFEKDVKGELNGHIVEVGAMAQFSKATPKYPRSAYLYLLTQQLEEYSKAGYTTVVAPGLQAIIPKHLQSLKEVSEHHNAPVKMFTYPMHQHLDKSALRPHQGNQEFTVLGPKLWIDGSPYAGGMAMKEPYLANSFTQKKLGISEGSLGHLTYDDASLEKLIGQYHQQGWQISAHVQGERAAKQFMDALEKVLKNHPRKDHRHRMEHNALVTASQLSRAKKLGITVSFYIDHINYYGDALAEHIVGQARAERFMAVKSAIKSGHTVTLHTDTPSSPLGPIRAMRVAIMRNTQSNRYVLGENETITAMEAIKALTINSAWQIFEENSRGSLEVGKLADFTILNKNLLTTPPKDWELVEVDSTYLNGERVENKKWSARKISLVVQTAWEMLLEKVIH